MIRVLGALRCTRGRDLRLELGVGDVGSEAGPGKASTPHRFRVHYAFVPRVQVGVEPEPNMDEEEEDEEDERVPHGVRDCGTEPLMITMTF